MTIKWNYESQTWFFDDYTEEGYIYFKFVNK